MILFDFSSCSIRFSIIFDSREICLQDSLQDVKSEYNAYEAFVFGKIKSSF